MLTDTAAGAAAPFGTDAPGFRFECPVSVFKAEDKPEGKKRRIAGIISTDREDRQAERILQDGLTFDDFLAHGWMNDNHSAKTTDILGYPETVQQFKVGDTLPDGQVAEANCTWMEGFLLDTPDATKVWELARSLAKTNRRLGYSVEGQIVERTGANDSVIAKAKVRNVAITNCFPGNVRVIASARGISRRVYDGPLVELKLASGHKVSGTPNHPVLTQRGWIPLGELDHVHDRVGRCLGKAGEMFGPGQDIQDMPPRLDEVYNAAQNSGCVHHVREGCQGDFHGDGTDSNVDIIAATGLLRGTGQAAFDQHFHQLLLACPDASQLGFSAQGSALVLDVLRDGALPSSLGGKGKGFALLRRACAIFAPIFGHNIAGDTGSSDQLVDPFARDAEGRGEAIAPFAVRIPREYFSFLRSGKGLLDAILEHLLLAKGLAHSGVTGPALCGDGVGAVPFAVHPDPVGDIVGLFDRGAGSDDTSLVADVDDARLADPRGTGDLGSALTGSIAFENIVSHSIGNFSGHVYNLDSVPGWYVANSIPSRNCPVNTDSRLEVLARSLAAYGHRIGKAMTLTDSSGSAGPVTPNRPYTGRGAGQVISRERLDQRRRLRRNSSRKLSRSEAAAYVKSLLPDASETLVRAIVAATISNPGRGI